MTKQELLAIARKLLRAELTEALDRLKPEHQDSLVVQIAAKPLLEWVTALDLAEDAAPKLARLQEAELMLAEFLLVVSKPALYGQGDLEDLQKRAGKLLKEMRA